MHLYTIGTRTRICGLSTEFFSVLVPWYQDADSMESLPVTPEGNLHFAFTPTGAQPGPTEWVQGSWSAQAGDYYGRVLIGPESDVQLSVGSYDVWARIIVPPQKIVQPLGSITIF